MPDFKNIGASSTLYSMTDLNAFPRSFTNISDGGAVVSQTLNGAQAVLQAQQVDQPQQIKPRTFKNIIEVGQLLISKETESLFLHGKGIGIKAILMFGRQPIVTALKPI